MESANRTGPRRASREAVGEDLWLGSHACGNPDACGSSYACDSSDACGSSYACHCADSGGGTDPSRTEPRFGQALRSLGPALRSPESYPKHATSCAEFFWSLGAGREAGGQVVWLKRQAGSADQSGQEAGQLAAPFC